MVIEVLVGAANAFFNLKDVHDLIGQAQLKALIDFLEKNADIHIKTAIEELKAMQHSTNPEREGDRAIGQLKIAANSLDASWEKRPVLWRLRSESERRKKKDVALQITGCYITIAGLYYGQKNSKLAKMYGAQAAEAFEKYASIRQGELASDIASEFVGVSSNDQAAHYFIYSYKQDELAAHQKRFRVIGDQDVFWRLADEKLDETRAQLFGWLKSLE